MNPGEDESLIWHREANAGEFVIGLILHTMFDGKTAASLLPVCMEAVDLALGGEGCTELRLPEGFNWNDSEVITADELMDLVGLSWMLDDDE